MKERTKEIIQNIIIIKINLLFMVIFTGAMLYTAEMLGNAIRIREILFWSTILLMIMFQTIHPMRKALDTVEEMVNRKKDANCTKSEEVKE